MTLNQWVSLKKFLMFKNVRENVGTSLFFFISPQCFRPNTTFITFFLYTSWQCVLLYKELK